MDFAKHMLPVTKENVFKERGYFVWCGTMLEENGTYYLLYSRWPKATGMNGWVSDSEICIAAADSPFGPFKHEKVLFTKQQDDCWDRDCFHNPAAICWGGRFYLYYMGNYGKGDFWSHRNHQRIGVAWADSVLGPWHRSEKPVLDVSEDGFDSLMTSNPTATQTPDGRIILMYKGVSKDGPAPAGGPVVCGTAIADRPEGPFVKTEKPIMVNPENPWSVEDPCLWYDGTQYTCLVKDFQGYFTKTNTCATALFHSQNGLTDYLPDPEHPLAFLRQIHWADGTVQDVCRMERPQIFIENGKPKALLCAVAVDEEWSETFNLQIPLDF